MQKEAEDPDKELQEELQEEEDAITKKKQSKGRGRGRARGRGRGRSRGCGRGAKAAAAVEQVGEEKPKNKPAQKKNEPAQKKNEPAQKTAEDASCSVGAETPHHPCDPDAPNQNDDDPSMDQKPRTAVRRKSSRSKLKRLKHMSPSSSAKKKQRQETGVEVADSQVDHGEPILEDSQAVPSPGVTLPPRKRRKRRQPMTMPSTIPSDGWPVESLEEEPENNVEKDEAPRDETEKDELDKEELRDNDADSDEGGDKRKEKDQAALIAKDPTIKCIKWSLSKTSQHVLWRTSRFVHCFDFVS